MDTQPPFVRHIITAMREQCHVQPRQTLLVAVSGGTDSVALLHVLASLRDKRRWHLQLVAGHVNHHLRDDADEDAQLVATLASQWDIPFMHAALNPTQRPPNQNVEKWARHARYEALSQMARETDAAAIVTAHHADDQLETMLMRLLRGAGVKALAGMAWSRRLSGDNPLMLHRPMLGVTHAQAVAYLKQHDIPWREDPTNADTSRTRAALRAHVLPALAAIAPHYPSRVSQTSNHLRSLAQLHQQQVDQALAQLMHADTQAGTLTFDRQKLRALPQAMCQSVLREAMLQAGASADALRQRDLARLARATRDHQGGQRQFQFASRLHLTLTRETLTIQNLRES